MVLDYFAEWIQLDICWDHGLRWFRWLVWWLELSWNRFLKHLEKKHLIPVEVDWNDQNAGIKFCQWNVGHELWRIRPPLSPGVSSTAMAFFRPFCHRRPKIKSQLLQVPFHTMFHRSWTSMESETGGSSISTGKSKWILVRVWSEFDQSQPRKLSSGCEFVSFLPLWAWWFRWFRDRGRGRFVGKRWSLKETSELEVDC